MAASEENVRLILGFRACVAMDSADESRPIQLVRSALDSRRNAMMRMRDDHRSGALAYYTVWFNRLRMPRAAYLFMSLSDTEARGDDARWGA